MTSAYVPPDVRYGTVDRDYAALLAGSDDDGPVWMVNLMSYRDVADYDDGRESSITGREADDLYAPLGELAAVGAEIVFLGEVEAQLLGDAPRWDRVAVVCYPTRRAFIDLQLQPGYEERHVHKDAGMAATIIIAGVPIPTRPFPDDAPTWSEVPHPPTDDDPAIVVLHVMRFVDGPGSIDEMTQYQETAGLAAVPQGVRLAGWFGVEGTVVGDGRPWHQARFNAFPSRAAFQAVAFDPARLEAQREHRERAIADTYTMILRPVIDRLHQSVHGVPQPA
jgi:hypothetical protein